MAEKKHKGTKDKAKCSFYKSKRKKGFGEEEIRKLWIDKKMEELKAKEAAKAAEEAEAKAKAEAQVKWEAEKKARAEAKAQAEAEAKAKAEAEVQGYNLSPGCVYG